MYVRTPHELGKRVVFSGEGAEKLLHPVRVALDGGLELWEREWDSVMPVSAALVAIQWNPSIMDTLETW